MVVVAVVVEVVAVAVVVAAVEEAEVGEGVGFVVALSASSLSVERWGFGPHFF